MIKYVRTVPLVIAGMYFYHAAATSFTTCQTAMYYLPEHELAVVSIPLNSRRREERYLKVRNAISSLLH
jgi:uncharacterized lipoprotein NlpE involved in copper resistance